MTDITLCCCYCIACRHETPLQGIRVLERKHKQGHSTPRLPTYNIFLCCPKASRTKCGYWGGGLLSSRPASNFYVVEEDLKFLILLPHLLNAVATDMHSTSGLHSARNRTQGFVRTGQALYRWHHIPRAVCLDLRFCFYSPCFLLCKPGRIFHIFLGVHVHTQRVIRWLTDENISPLLFLFRYFLRDICFWAPVNL